MPGDQIYQSALPRLERARMRPLTLPEQIANRIGQDILDGAYQPGEPLREQDLSDAYQVSRGPVREALRILEMDGVVRILPNKGAQVTQLTVQEVADIFEIRAALIGVSTERLCAEMPDALLEQAAAITTQMRAVAASLDGGPEFARLSHQLSVMLISATPNRRLSEMLLSLARQTLRYTRLGLASVARRQRSAQVWSELVDLMAQGDGPRAGALAKTLMLESRDAAISALTAQV
ncbi:GntR family transcriptional regulator [Pararhodobacter sp.]|uniref:GntR family transcriptional regulator n=1 Tax=Pararhodobacter sp. TaxID=2127056 RepID=UPI002AFF8718|nr:GntR family transcriptional regulator [Pararhodobacter sp.]